MAGEWNTSTPVDHTLISDLPGEHRSRKTDTKTVMEKSHQDLGDGNSGGLQLQGSAVAFFLPTASAPATNEDGTAFTSADLGKLWWDTTLSQMKVLVATAPTWTVLPSLAQASTWAALQTFAAGIGVSGAVNINAGTLNNVLTLLSTDTVANLLMSDSDTTGGSEAVLKRVADLLVLNPIGTGDTQIGSATGSNDRSIADKGYVDAQIAALSAIQTSSTEFDVTVGGANTFEDLDISEAVGENVALVYFKVVTGDGDVKVRPKGSAGTWSNMRDTGVGGLDFSAIGHYGYGVVITDSSGIVEIACATTDQLTLTVLGYII